MIEAGSVVREKGGIVKMTVATIVNGVARVQWFDHNDRLHQATIPIERLELAPARK